MISRQRLEEMRAHVDEGGKLQHEIAVELLDECERLRKHNAMARALIDDASTYIRKARRHAAAAH